MDEFKEAHKQYQKSLQENSQLRELRGDIDIIEMEKENGMEIVYFEKKKFIFSLKVYSIFWWRFFCLICVKMIPV